MTAKVNYYEKYIHYNPDLEDAIIGACMLEMDALARIRNIVEPEHFHIIENSTLYRVMCEMWQDGMAIDLITVTQEVYKKGLENTFQYQNGAPYYITCLMNAV